MSNLSAKDLYGCMTALVTPMADDGSINYHQWRNLLQWQIQSGIKAVVVAGTTGESALLKKNEFKQLLKIAVETCQDSGTKVIAQTGHIEADKVIESNQWSHEIGAHAVLVVTPYYIRTTQLGLEKHFTKIAENSQLPMLLYNVPSRTQNDMSAATTARLATHENIIGIKEASAEKQRINELVTLIKQDFAIMSGNDDTFLCSMQQGATGIISVASNVRPHAITQICNFVALGDINSANKLNSSLDTLYKMLSYQPNPIPVKYMLQQIGLISSGIRMPLDWFEGKLEGIQHELQEIKKELNFKI